MRKIMKTTGLVLVIAFALSAVTVQAGWSWKSKGIEGSGDMETRELDLGGFDSINVGGAFELDVVMGEHYEVKLTIDDNLWDNLEAKVRDGELTIDWDKSCQPDDDCRIEIVTPRLAEVSIHGACDANIEDYQGDSFRYILSGAGSLKMDGEVDELEIRVSGAGDADTRDLKAKHVDISVSGAGDAKVYAGESIKARVSGVGSIHYYGDPEKKSTKVSGIGSIKSR
jgi:hypothetical protein